MIEERDDERTLRRANVTRIEIVATPHPSLPLKGGGEESGDKEGAMSGKV